MWTVPRRSGAHLGVEIAAGAAMFQEARIVAAEVGHDRIEGDVFEGAALADIFHVAPAGRIEGMKERVGNAVELAQLTRHAQQADWKPLLLSPALLSERNIFDLPDSFSGRVLLAYASLPTDYSPEGAEEFELLHEKYGFDYSYSIAQVNAYIAAKVLIEALDRAGRRLSRAKIVTALEELDDFHPGLAPALSYGEDRRIGSVGVHIVPVDLVEDRFTEPVRWIVPRDPD